MIMHVLTFTWNDAATDEKVAALALALREFASTDGAADTFACGPDLGLRPGNADFGLVATFADQATFRAYLDHPAHQRIVQEQVLPILKDRAGVQLAG